MLPVTATSDPKLRGEPPNFSSSFPSSLSSSSHYLHLHRHLHLRHPPTAAAATSSASFSPPPPPLFSLFGSRWTSGVDGGSGGSLSSSSPRRTPALAHPASFSSPTSQSPERCRADSGRQRRSGCSGGRSGGGSGSGGGRQDERTRWRRRAAVHFSPGTTCRPGASEERTRPTQEAAASQYAGGVGAVAHLRYLREGPETRGHPSAGVQAPRPPHAAAGAGCGVLGASARLSPAPLRAGRWEQRRPAGCEQEVGSGEASSDFRYCARPEWRVVSWWRETAGSDKPGLDKHFPSRFTVAQEAGVLWRFRVGGAEVLGTRRLFLPPTRAARWPGTGAPQPPPWRPPQVLGGLRLAPSRQRTRGPARFC